MGCFTGIIITLPQAPRRGKLGRAPETGASDWTRSPSGSAGSTPPIDTVAVEVERISEAQRFTAKVLAERSTPALPDWLPESSTPHWTRSTPQLDDRDRPRSCRT